MSLYDRIVLTERRNLAGLMRKGGALVRSTGGRTAAGRATRKAAFNVKARADYEQARKARRAARPGSAWTRKHQQSGTSTGKALRREKRAAQATQRRGHPQKGAPGAGQGAARLQSKLGVRRASGDSKPGYKMVFGKWVRRSSSSRVTGTQQDKRQG